MFWLKFLLFLCCYHYTLGQKYSPYIPSLPFKHIHTNTAIDGPEPWFDGEVASKDHCFDKCVKNFTHCVYVQYKEITATTWICNLFDAISDLSNYLVSKKGEMLAFAVHKNIDCKDWKDMGYFKSGVYYIYYNRKKIKVRCSMSAKPGMVIQRRINGSVNFTRSWKEYKDGFGNLDDEFWLGNDLIHHLTKDRDMQIWFNLFDFNGGRIGVAFKPFSIEDESNQYRLHTGDASGGTLSIGGDWKGLDRMKFSTPEVDHDPDINLHCGQIYQSGWWYKQGCGKFCLNCRYSQTASTGYSEGIYWPSYRGDSESLKAVIISIRRTDY
ncbi:fibroleukin-like [Clytia hemisphaerica]|eukprot:TCONS_00030423-protein